jgi:vitamin B12 transporter
MSFSASPRAGRSRVLHILIPVLLAIALSTTLAVSCSAASIHGVVTDTSGAKVTGAIVDLLIEGKVVGTAVSTADGSFQIMTGIEGRFYLVVSASSFRQLQTPGFYAGRLDNIERNLVLEPAWVHESIVVTATGTPTPQAQTSAATTVLGPSELAHEDTLVSALRIMPGTFVTQDGQMGAQSSLFVRGGNSDSNKIMVDGVDATDLGGNFDLGPLSTTAVESAEVYRGTNSDLYGAGAGSSVVSLTTPHGTTSFPSLIFNGDAGNLLTSHENLELAGSHNKFDYLGDFSWLQTVNDLPRDEYHVATSAANIGWQPNGTTQIRGTIHYGVDATGVPNAWDFYHIADNATQKDQDIFLSGSIDNQTTADFHQSARYAMTRKREQYNQWSQEGIIDENGDGLGELISITGANGYSVTGSAILDYGGTYPYGYQLVNNRDQLLYQGDYRFTPHLAALVGFHFEDERGDENIPAYSTFDQAERTNYDYIAAVHGDFKSRFFYSLSGSLEHYSQFGTQTAPRAGLTYYALKPRQGIFSGTRVLFNYGQGVREPKLTEQFASLYTFLNANGFQSAVQQLKIGPLAAPETRSYEGGVEQAFFSEHLLFKASYFHNEFGKEIESVGAVLLTQIIPGLTATDLGYYYSYDIGLDVNTQAFRAQGIEASVEGGIGRNLFMRGGYTYLDTVVQRSFDSDNEALLGGYAPAYNGIPIGDYSPLVGARPFRRPPHTGFFTTTYTRGFFTGLFNAAFASRSDDSTFLSDANYGTTLLLPNRNLDYGYAKLDVGGSYQVMKWLGVYAQAENLLDNQHIAPIGYPSLPFTVRAGLKLQWGLGHKE